MEWTGKRKISYSHPLWQDFYTSGMITINLNRRGLTSYAAGFILHLWGKCQSMTNHYQPQSNLAGLYRRKFQTSEGLPVCRARYRDISPC